MNYKASQRASGATCNRRVRFVTACARACCEFDFRRPAHGARRAIGRRQTTRAQRIPHSRPWAGSFYDYGDKAVGWVLHCVLHGLLSQPCRPGRLPLSAVGPDLQLLRSRPFLLRGRGRHAAFGVRTSGPSCSRSYQPSPSIPHTQSAWVPDSPHGQEPRAGAFSSRFSDGAWLALGGPSTRQPGSVSAPTGPSSGHISVGLLRSQVAVLVAKHFGLVWVVRRVFAKGNAERIAPQTQTSLFSGHDGIAPRSGRAVLICGAVTADCCPKHCPRSSLAWASQGRPPSYLASGDAAGDSHTNAVQREMSLPRLHLLRSARGSAAIRCLLPGDPHRGLTTFSSQSWLAAAHAAAARRASSSAVPKWRSLASSEVPRRGRPFFSRSSAVVPAATAFRCMAGVRPSCVEGSSEPDHCSAWRPSGRHVLFLRVSTMAHRAVNNSRLAAGVGVLENSLLLLPAVQLGDHLMTAPECLGLDRCPARRNGAVLFTQTRRRWLMAGGPPTSAVRSTTGPTKRNAVPLQAAGFRGPVDLCVPEGCCGIAFLQQPLKTADWLWVSNGVRGLGNAGLFLSSQPVCRACCRQVSGRARGAPSYASSGALGPPRLSCSVAVVHASQPPHE